MSETQDIDSPIARSEENVSNSASGVPVEREEMNKLTNDDTESQKLEKSNDGDNDDDRDDEAKSSAAKAEINKLEDGRVEEEGRKIVESTGRDENKKSRVEESKPTSPTIDCKKPGEWKLLPVLVERLRSALEQSCSGLECGVEKRGAPRVEETTAVEEAEALEADLRVWASGLSSTREEKRGGFEESTSRITNPRGLKLDLKFLEDLLLSDIQTALGRLQETLVRVDIGTLTRYSSGLDPTNKLNLLKLISSLLANLKIPEESIVNKPEERSTKTTSTRRRRADRHTIGVTSEELARARKWLEEKHSTPRIVADNSGFTPSETDRGHPEKEINTKRLEMRNERPSDDNPIDSQNEYDKVPDKYMKDALNQQQSLLLLNKSNVKHALDISPPGGKDRGCDREENSLTNDHQEYGIPALSLHNESNVQAKCNKFMAKKSKIKRANTIDIPNYLKLQAESMANARANVSLRKPINIGDRYSQGVSNVIPSFEPKTENDRKFLALISKNNENNVNNQATPGLPFKSFNYRQVASAALADTNWNSRFSDIKTTFDKPTPAQDYPGQRSRAPSSVMNETKKIEAKKLPRYSNLYQSPAAFSHAPTSPFHKIQQKQVNDKQDESTGGFFKAGYVPVNGKSTLRAKVKLFDHENKDPGDSLIYYKKPSNEGDGNYLRKNKSRAIDENTDNPKYNYRKDSFGTKNLDTEKYDNYCSKDPFNIGNNKEKRNSKFENKIKYGKFANFNSRDIVAYPFEIDQKRSSFGNEYSEPSRDKVERLNSEDPRDEYMKSVVGPRREPPPPPRANQSMQSVAVQTLNHDQVPPAPVYQTERTLSNFLPIRDEAFDSRRSQYFPMNEQRGENHYSENPIIRRDSLGLSCNLDYQAPESYSRLYCPPRGNNQSQGDEPQPEKENEACRRVPRVAKIPHQSLDYNGASRNYHPREEMKAEKEESALFKNKRPLTVKSKPERASDNCYEESLLYRENKNPIYVPPVRYVEMRQKYENPGTIGHLHDYLNTESPSIPAHLNPHSNYDPEQGKSCNDRSFEDDEDYEDKNEEIPSKEQGVVTRYTCAIATVSPSVTESPMISPFSSELQDVKNEDRKSIYDKEEMKKWETSDPYPVIPYFYREERNRVNEEESNLDQIRRHNLLQQNLIRQMQAEQGTVTNYSRRFSQDGERPSERDVPSNNKTGRMVDKPEEKLIESNNTQDKINIFEERKQRKHEEKESVPLRIPRKDRCDRSFVPPKINIVSPSKVFESNPANSCFKFPRKDNPTRKMDSSDEYLISCASKPSRSLVLSKSESWHQLAMSKGSSNTLKLPQIDASSLLKPPKPKSPSSLKLSKQYEASSSSEGIRKMEEKIQQYFRGPASSGHPESPLAARKDRSKRNLLKMNPGSLVRSQTMPHIFDESTDVEKAFDSLFREATRPDH